jgi:hypothetical protein
MVTWLEQIQKNAVELIVVVDKLDREADAETIEFRKMQCAKCPNNIDGKCNICKCFIDIKTTTKVNRRLDGTKEITHCPEGRWKDMHLRTFYSLLN